MDHAFVTHAHQDHIGALLDIVDNYPHVSIHLTPATHDLADFVLRASARLQRRKYREGSSLQPPLFSEEDVEFARHLFTSHDYGEVFNVSTNEHPLIARFYWSGHILGSAGVHLTFDEDGHKRQLFYTSDTNLRPQTIIPGGDYPEGPVDILVLETTLGADPDAELSTRRAEERRFCDKLQEVLARGGTVLVPVFMLGRAQEILALLDRFKRQGHIDPSVPVYTAGGMREISKIYDDTRRTTPRLSADFEVYGVDQLRVPKGVAAKRQALGKPGIHVVTSGMMFEHTLSNWMAQQIVESDTHAIFLVGFAKEDSPAGRLLEAVENGEHGILLDRHVGPQPLKCDVERFRFSGHSHRRDLVDLVSRLVPKKVVLIHGETEARQWMAKSIRSRHDNVDIVLPTAGVPLEI